MPATKKKTETDRLEKEAKEYDKDLKEAKQLCWDTYHQSYKPLNSATIPDLNIARRNFFRNKDEIEELPEFEVLAGLISPEDFKKRAEQEIQKEKQTEETEKQTEETPFVVEEIIGDIIIQCGNLVKSKKFNELTRAFINLFS